MPLSPNVKKKRRLLAPFVMLRIDQLSHGFHPVTGIEAGFTPKCTG